MLLAKARRQRFQGYQVLGLAILELALVLAVLALSRTCSSLHVRHCRGCSRHQVSVMYQIRNRQPLDVSQLQPRQVLGPFLSQRSPCLSCRRQLAWPSRPMTMPATLKCKRRRPGASTGIRRVRWSRWTASKRAALGVVQVAGSSAASKAEFLVEPYQENTRGWPDPQSH